MTCPGDGSTGDRQSTWTFRNWARTRTFIVPLKLRPNTLQQIVACVEEAERSDAVLKAMGSGWSYSDAAVDSDATRVVDTSSLVRLLSGADPSSPTTLLPFALNDPAQARARYYVHVEAGIKIYALNCLLDGMRDETGVGLALPTLGGSNGQSLAGVLSTGTHGTDVDFPPIVDAVRAVHLVGPGGREWWIERSGDDAITDGGRMEAARSAGRLCADLRIEYDTALFRAALVSLGRMGVVYSVVLEAVDAFRLRETRERGRWSETASWIRTNIVNAESYAGPRAMEVVLSPYPNDSGDRDCVITRRTESALPPSPESPPSPDPFQMLCSFESIKPLLSRIALLLPPLIILATAAAIATISFLLAIPIIGGIIFGALLPVVVAAATTALIALETALLALISSRGDNLAEKLAEICNLAVSAGQKQLVPQLINMIIGQIRNPDAPTVVRESFRIMTGQAACGTQWQDSAACMRQIDGLEFALNASRGREELFRFINAVFALTSEFYNANRPPGFAMSLRFTRSTSALLGMQQFDRTCSVEFIMLRGFRGHTDFIRRLYLIARQQGAIPHWGLIHDLDASEVRALYGDNHSHWRRQLGRLLSVGGRLDTFSTTFSRRRELEPMTGCLLPRWLLGWYYAIRRAARRAREVRRAGAREDRP